jgi:hypothetical protein
LGAGGISWLVGDIDLEEKWIAIAIVSWKMALNEPVLFHLLSHSKICSGILYINFDFGPP